MMQRRPVHGFTTGVAVSFLLAGCHDLSRSGPEPALPGAPSFEIVDAVHNGGNAHFFFLPPLVSSPTTAGVFDATQSPTVVVCQLAGATCGPTIIAQFSMTSGTGAEVVRVDLTNELYIVNWHTDECVTGPCTLDPTLTYRLRVLVAGTELGHADVQVVMNQGQAKSIDTQQFIALVDGRTLPVKFRIEQGAVFVVGPSTQPQTIQTPTTASGTSVTLVIPAGALTQTTGITVAPGTPPAGTSTTALVSGAVFNFGPTGTAFATPVTVTLQYNPANLPTGAAERTLRLFTLVNGVWVLVPGSTVNVVTHAVTGLATHFSTYGVNASASVSAGAIATCGIGTSGRTVCWGDNLSGELGNNSTTGPDQCDASFPCALTPTLVATADTLLLVSVGGGHVCGVTTLNTVDCWGATFFGQLGNGTTSGAQQCGVSGVTNVVPCNTTPVTVSGGLRFATVSAGADHTCGVTTTGAAYCWGLNTSGQLGDNTSAGPENCSQFGQTFACSTLPVAVAGGLTFTLVSAGATHSCGLTNTGDAYCWGSNFAGELGDNASGGPQQCPSGGGSTFPCSTTPVLVAGGLSFASLSAGASYTCGVTTANAAYCWGENFTGQLGDGTSASKASPAAVAGSLNFATLAASGVVSDSGHTCGATTAGTAYCWGFGQEGELGNGASGLSLTPVPVSGNLGFLAVSPGGIHTCGITSAPNINTAYCWGGNSQGQLGNGTTIGSSTPAQVSTLP